MTFEDVWLVGVKYRIKTLELIIGNTYKYTVSNKLILSMTIVEDYDQWCFPYFELAFSVPTDTYRLMQKHATDIKATMNIQKAKFKDAISTEVDTSQAFKNCINNTFYVYFNDTTPELSETEQKIVESSNNNYGTLAVAKVLLYPYDYYNKYDLIVNDSLQNTTLADAITLCLNRCGVTNVLMSPPTNCRRYSQFIITPISLVNQLDRICNSYGIHATGTMIFFGLQKLYILDKAAKCTTYETNEFTVTYIIANGKTMGSNQTGGCYEHLTKKYNLVNATYIDIKDNEQTSLKTVGSNVVAVGSSGTVTKSNNGASSTTNVVVYEEGEATLNALNLSISENANIITVNFTNVDIDMLSPNKQFILTLEGTTEKSKYNGKYRITKVIHLFEKDGDIFTVTSTAEFKG